MKHDFWQPRVGSLLNSKITQVFVQMYIVGSSECSTKPLSNKNTTCISTDSLHMLPEILTRISYNIPGLTFFQGLPAFKLKARLGYLIFIVCARGLHSYFVEDNLESKEYSEKWIVWFLNFWLTKFLLGWGVSGHVFQQTVSIPLGTDTLTVNCTSLLVDLILYSYEAEFIQKLIKEGNKYLSKQFN